MDLITCNMYTFLWNWTSLSIHWNSMRTENIFIRKIHFFLPVPQSMQSTSHTFSRSWTPTHTSGLNLHVPPLRCLAWALKSPKCSHDNCSAYHAPSHFPRACSLISLLCVKSLRLYYTHCMFILPYSLMLIDIH